MKKRLLSLICLLLALLLALPAMADPIVTGNHGYTAYLGENNYLYLTDPQAVTKVLQTPIASLDGITEEYLYCTTADGRCYEVKLDGSSSRIVTGDNAALPAAAFTLEEGVLIPRSAGGLDLSGIPNVEAACAAADALYYVTANGMGGYALMSISLPIADVNAGSLSIAAAPTGTVVLPQVNKPLSITASPQAVVIVSENDVIEIYDRTAQFKETLTRPGAGLTHAFAYNDKLVTLSLSDEGQYTVLSSEDFILASNGPAAAMTTFTPGVTAAATVKATAAPTAKPTATPKPTAQPEEDDGRISLGDTGYAVRKMQRRLMELGYPVGKVDGDFGENTLLAVNLFQCAIGYRNRNYASESMLNKLYSKKASGYDPYAPLKPGDEGADVKIMQTFLDDLGYDLGKKGIDGKYGEDTKAAVEQFQFVAGMEVTGEADAETLLRLYDEEHPVPNATPNPNPTDAPTQAPTDKPTDTPTEQPTQKPTDAPTQEPTQKPTDAPTQEPEGNPGTPTDL